MSQFAHSRTLTCLCGSFSWDAGVRGAPVMADQEETFGLQNSPSGSESRDVQSENKPEKQNGTSSKSPSSQTTYIQQVSVARSVGRSVCQASARHRFRLRSWTSGVTLTVKQNAQVGLLFKKRKKNHNFWKAFYFVIFGV